MSYEMKPGDVAIYKNKDKAEGDKRPEYKGQFITEDGKECWIDLWVLRKEGMPPMFTGKNKFKEVKPAPDVMMGVEAEVVKDDLPF